MRGILLSIVLTFLFSGPLTAQIYRTVTSKSGAVSTTFHVAPELVLVAKHAVDGVGDELVVGNGRKAICVYRAAGRDDVAFARVKLDEDSKPLPLSKGGVDIGDRVTCLGFPMGIFAVRKGVIFQFTKSSRGDSVDAAMRCDPGQSGSPVFDISGKVIGMVSRTESGEDVAICVPAPIISKHLKKYRNGTDR